MPGLQIQRPLIGEFLFRQREKLNKTQKEFAAAAKVGKHRISRMETGREPVPEKMLPTLATVYQVSEDELRTLFDEQKVQNESNNIEDFVITHTELDYLSRLEPHLRGRLTVGLAVTLIKHFRSNPLNGDGNGH
jgi:transcriptional regulator with XRE-family HTH domain